MKKITLLLTALLIGCFSGCSAYDGLKTGYKVGKVVAENTLSDESKAKLSPIDKGLTKYDKTRTEIKEVLADSKKSDANISLVAE